MEKEINNNSAINPPKKKNIALSIIFTIITLGIYNCFWHILRVKELNNLNTQKKVGKAGGIIALLFLIVGILGVFWLAEEILRTTPIFPIKFTKTQLPIILVVVSTILLAKITLIFQAFKVRSIINEALQNKNSNVKISSIYTLLFNNLYLQYEINRIIDDKEQNKRKGPMIFLIILILLVLSASIILFLKYA